VNKKDFEKIDWQKGDGLVPVIVQDSITMQVLMLGYMSPEALAITLEGHRLTFYSRSKARCWTKGETSGNFLNLNELMIDCDNDTLLALVTPVGNVCHLGRQSCFLQENYSHYYFLNILIKVVEDRYHHPKPGSYTSKLFDMGIKRIAQKVAEEGVEVAIAAVTDDRDECVAELADLIYHLIVLMQFLNIDLATVVNEMHQRHQANIDTE